MKKLDESLDKKIADIDTENRRYSARRHATGDDIVKAKARKVRSRQEDSERKAAMAFLKVGGSVVTALVSFNVGVLHNDGGLFRGLFLQLLALTSGLATVVFAVQLVYYLFRRASDL